MDWIGLDWIGLDWSSYQKAAYCYEELILLQPGSCHVYVRLAEVHQQSASLREAWFNANNADIRYSI